MRHKSHVVSLKVRMKNHGKTIGYKLHQTNIDLVVVVVVCYWLLLLCF